MYKTYSFFVKNSDSLLFNYCKDLTHNYKNLKNVTNFYIRNTFTGIKKPPEERFSNEIEVLHFVFTGIQKQNILRDNKKASLFTYPKFENSFLNFNSLDAIFKFSNNIDYYSLPAQINQNAIKDVIEEWKSFFKAGKEYMKNPSKFTGRPKMPKYLQKDFSTVILNNQACKLKQNENNKTFCIFPKTKAKLFLGKYISINSILKSVRIVPISNIFKIELIIEEPDVKPLDNSNLRAISIDLGIKNIVTISNNIGIPPILIKGNVLYSKNKFFNKEIANYTSTLNKYKLFNSKKLNNLYFKRNRYITNSLHKISKNIIDYCVKNEINTIVIGLNKQWKSEVHLGKKTNQTFCQIPHTILIQMITYKGNNKGINIVEREESYTSKASFLDMDNIPNFNTKKDKKPIFSGKRIKRGLYQSKEKLLLNADVNGASNILRKEYKEAFNKIEDFTYLMNVKVLNI